MPADSPTLPPTPAPVRVVIRLRSDDWHASIAGQPGCWDRGSTPDEALGRLITTHRERFGIEVTIAEREAAHV